MMLAVVREGTATAVQIPGVPIAAKTGTAELRNDVTTPDGVSPPANPQNDDAWLVAFPAIEHPDVAAVMLVGAGAGGTSAAPIARAILERALSAPVI